MGITDRIERLKAARTLMECGMWLTAHATELMDWALDPSEGWTLTFALERGGTGPRFVAESGNRRYFAGDPVGAVKHELEKGSWR